MTLSTTHVVSDTGHTTDHNAMAVQVNANTAGLAVAAASVSGLAGPADQGLAAWGYDPLLASSSLALGSGQIHLVKAMVPNPVTINSILLCITGQASVGMTSAYACVILPNGSVSSTANVAATVNAAATNSLVTLPLSAPVTVGGGGAHDFVYLGIGYQTVTTAPTVARMTVANYPALNAGLAAGAQRQGVLTQNFTSGLPSSVTLTSIANSADGIWLGAI